MTRRLGPLLLWTACLLPAAAFADGVKPNPDPTPRLAKVASAPKKPAAPWWTRDDLGPTATRSMWLENLGDIGGLALSGIGEGLGGTARGIPSGAVTTVGRGEGGVDIDAIDGAHRSGSHESRAPRGASAVVRLPPEAVERIVRQNFGRFRRCYEMGRRSNPSLEGRVAVKFVIDPTGTVSVASDGGSDLEDAEVVGCVVRGFGALSFSRFEGSSVTVVYPLRFSPDS